MSTSAPQSEGQDLGQGRHDMYPPDAAEGPQDFQLEGGDRLGHGYSRILTTRVRTAALAFRTWVGCFVVMG